MIAAVQNAGIEETCPLEIIFCQKMLKPIILKAVPKSAGPEKSRLLFPMELCLLLTAFYVLE